MLFSVEILPVPGQDLLLKLVVTHFDEVVSQLSQFSCENGFHE